MDETQIRSRMQQVLDLVRSDVGTIRTGRATPALVEDIVVAAYGGQQRLRVQELGTITAPDTQTLVIDPWDKSIIGDIKRGIEAAKAGLTPVIAGEVIRINLPPLTTEDRENYLRMLNQKLENGKVQVRQARQEAMQKVKETFEKRELSEDEKVLQEKRVQELTDEYISKIEEIGENKEKELKQV